MKKLNVTPEIKAVVFILSMMVSVLPFSVQQVFAQEAISEVGQGNEEIEEIEGIEIPEDSPIDLSGPAESINEAAPESLLLGEFKEYETNPNVDLNAENVTVYKPEANIIERQIEQAQPSAVIQTEYIDTYEYAEPDVKVLKPEFQEVMPQEQAGPSAPIHAEYTDTAPNFGDYEIDQNVEVLQPEFKAIEPTEQAGPSAAIHTEYIPEYKYEDPATEGVSENQDLGALEGE
ncbi:MAG: hypothetical protein PHN59_02300 [Candidatus Omnitrophica bacterium]|nr:hypothetical protein [Candidatus Omnitrophota bacterium]